MHIALLPTRFIVHDPKKKAVRIKSFENTHEDENSTMRVRQLKMWENSCNIHNNLMLLINGQFFFLHFHFHFPQFSRYIHSCYILRLFIKRISREREEKKIIKKIIFLIFYLIFKKNRIVYSFNFPHDFIPHIDEKKNLVHQIIIISMTPENFWLGDFFFSSVEFLS